MRQRCDDRRFLLSAEFFAVAGHLRTSEDIWRPSRWARNSLKPNPTRKELAHAAIDAGADIVYGHGSHVLQGAEVYKGKPVMYCLGNLATDWIRMRPNKDGIVARVVIDKKRVTRVSLTPVTRDAENNNVLMLDPSTGEGARSGREANLQLSHPSTPTKSSRPNSRSTAIPAA